MAPIDGFYQDCADSASGAYKYFDGEWKVSTSGKTVKILNPCTNNVQYEVQGERLPGRFRPPELTIFTPIRS
jgi:hypothetical protein